MGHKNTLEIFQMHSYFSKIIHVKLQRKSGFFGCGKFSRQGLFWVKVWTYSSHHPPPKKNRNKNNNTQLHHHQHRHHKYRIKQSQMSLRPLCGEASIHSTIISVLTLQISNSSAWDPELWKITFFFHFTSFILFSVISLTKSDQII